MYDFYGFQNRAGTNKLITVAVSLFGFTVDAPAGWVPPQVLSPQKENAPPVPVQPPFSGWHLALHPVCSAVLVTRGSETQLHLFHAADVWQTIGGVNMMRKRQNMSVCSGSRSNKMVHRKHNNIRQASDC